MSFFNEIEKVFAIDEIKKDFSIHIIGGNCVIVEGYRKILSFSTSEIVLLLKRNDERILIKGIKMIIKKLETNEIVLGGEILSVERQVK